MLTNTLRGIATITFTGIAWVGITGALHLINRPDTSMVTLGLGMALGVIVLWCYTMKCLWSSGIAAVLGEGKVIQTCCQSEGGCTHR